MNQRRKKKRCGVVRNKDGAISYSWGAEEKDISNANTLHRFGPWPLGYNGPVDMGGPMYAPVAQLLVMGGIQRLDGQGPYDPIDPGNPGQIAFNINLELMPLEEDQQGDGRGNTAVRILLGDGNPHRTASAGAAFANAAAYTAITAFPIGPAALSLSFSQNFPSPFGLSRGFCLWSIVPLSWRQQ